MDFSLGWEAKYVRRFHSPVIDVKRRRARERLSLKKVESQYRRTASDFETRESADDFVPLSPVIPAIEIESHVSYVARFMISRGRFVIATLVIVA